MQQRKQELQSTKDNIAYLNNEIARMEKDHEEMIGNPQRLEQYAREQYLMKRDNEDVYAVSYTHLDVYKRQACICAAGYEGTQCEIVTREKYKGVWSVYEKGTYTETTQYQISIDYGSDMTKMVVNGFNNNITQPVNIRISGDEITIPQQTINGYEIQGKGTLKYDAFYAKHGQLTVRYTIKDLSNNMTNDYGVNTGEPSLWSK